jgi:hypothetical protein
VPFTLTVRNLGANPSHGVTVTSSLPTSTAPSRPRAASRSAARRARAHSGWWWLACGRAAAPKLLNASGLTAGRQQFVRIDAGGDNILDPSESVAFQLVFSQPCSPRRLQVLAAAFA